MKKGILFLAIFLGICLLPSCVEEDFPDIAVIEGADQVAPIVSPCEYYDTARVIGAFGMDKMYDIDYYAHFDEEDLIFRFYSSPNVIRIRYNDIRGYKYINSQVVDYSGPNKSKVDMEIIYWDGSNRHAEAVSGELYFVRQDDGSLKVDWCDVVFYEAKTDSYYNSFGGTLVKF